MAPLVDVYTPLPGYLATQYPSQSITVDGTKRPGQTAHYRNPKWSELKLDYALATLPKLFESGLEQARHLPFLGHRGVVETNPLTLAPQYTWQTYDQVDKRRRAVGSALQHLFTTSKLAAGADFEGVGIWALNRPEWQIVDLACHAYSKASVALYDTLGPTAVEYAINHSELPIIFCSSNHIDNLLDLASRCPSLKMIVSFDPLETAVRAVHTEKGKEKGVEILTFTEFEEIGTSNLTDPIEATLNQIAMINYTSGTSGTPKGVVLTHQNFANAILCYLHGLPTVPQHAILLSYLPLAHVYGRLIELLMATLGGRIGYYGGNPLKILEDVQILKPDIFPAVPRILNKIYQVAMVNYRAPGLKGYLFRWAVDSKMSTYRSTGQTTHWFWDRLIFSKIQAVLGGRTSLIISGSAPVNRDALDFFKISFVCEVVEAYGLTEVSAVCTKALADDPTATGTVGGVTPINEVKLVDVPELNYHADDTPNPRGEICVKGPNVFSRYYKDEKTTAEAFDADGWFHTGDVGEFDQQGRLKIIDRVKNIMKLSQGEYVALEKVENLYAACPLVTQILVYGNSTQDHLVAVVIPDPTTLAPVASAVGHKFDPTNPAAVAAAIQQPPVVKAALDALTDFARKDGGLKGFETVKAVHLTMEQFTVDNGTLTPTFKLRRRDACAMYKDVLEGLYAKKGI